MPSVNANQIDVIAPNFKKRLSGVTATVVRLVPLQAKELAIAATGPDLGIDLPHIATANLLRMTREGPSGARVWHARRNTEMLAGLVLKHVLRKRLKLLFTSASQRRHTAYSKWLIGLMDKVIATSAKGAAYLDDLDAPVDVVHHGINTESFCPHPERSALREELGLPREGPLLGCYGRIRAQKGTDVFVDTMIGVLHQHPRATGIVMGRATSQYQSFEQELRDRVEQAGLVDRILFLPEVPVWQMAAWYQVLDLYIAPQRWEGFGLTPLEAMACGAPVLATRVGAFEELIIPGTTGALVEPGETDEMTRAALALLEPAERLEQMRQNARAHILANFRIEGEAERLNAIYRQLLNAA